MTRPFYLTEIFSSIQGETSLTGLPTIFIRFSGCNLRCTWCDTTYSFKRGKPVTFDDLIKQVQAMGPKLVCITGGEPLLQPRCAELMEHLCDMGYTVSLETSGSLSTRHVDPRVKIILDIKCPGSGMSHKNYWANLDNLRSHDEIKFVIANRVDYEWTKEIINTYQLDKKSHLLLSPAWGLQKPDELVAWMLEDFLPARLNLQLHKFIWGATKQGV